MAENDVVERAKRELRRRKALAEIQRRQSMAPEQTADKEPYTGMLLPWSTDEQGNNSLAVPRAVSGMIEGAKEAVSAPTRAYTGELPMTGPDGRTSEEAIAEAFNMATMVSPASTALASGERMIPGVGKNLVPAEQALSADAIKSVAREGYEGAQNLGVEFAPEALKGLSDNTLQELFAKGFVDETAPKTTSLLKRVGDVPTAAADETVTAPLSSVEAARRGLNNAARNFNNPPDAEAARLARRQFDQFLREPPEGAVLSGDAQAASELLREADKNWAAAKKSDLITGAEDAADLRAAVANSGANAGNAARQRVASLLLNKKTASRFSGQEKEALESVARGTKTENVTRALGNYLGGGGGLGGYVTSVGSGLGAMMATGHPTAAALGLLPMGIGVGSKLVSNALTKGHLKEVEEAIRAAAPASRKATENIPDQVIRERAKELVMRALMAKQTQQQDQQFWDAYSEGNAF